MQRIRLRRCTIQNQTISSLGFVQPPALMMRLRFAKECGQPTSPLPTFREEIFPSRRRSSRFTMAPPATA